MRIALVCPYSCTVPGGVQTQVLGLARALAPKGDEVVVIGPAESAETAGRVDADSLQGARFLPVGRSLPISVNGSRAPVSPFPATMARTVSALRSFSPDIVHIHEPFVPGPSLAATGFGPRPVVATFHRSGADIAYRAYGRLVGRWSEHLDEVYAVSDEARRTAETCVGRLVGRLEIIPNGVEGARWPDLQPWPKQGPTVVFVGRHEHRKGLEVLLEAFSGLPADARLWALGVGPESARLRARFAKDGRIEWPGAVDDLERERRLAGADVFCAPSLGGESFGVVLLEAMAAGTAVVASDLSGYRLAAGQAACLVRPGEPRALAWALGDVLYDEDTRLALVEKGRLRAAECDMALVAERYRDIYLRLARSGRD